MFWWSPLGSPYKVSCHLQIVKVLFLSNQYRCFFICFCCFIAMARTPNPMLNNSGVSGHLYLVPDHRGKALRGPGWLSQLGIWLLISVQVMISRSWDEVLSQALHVGWSLLNIFSLPLHLLLPCSCSSALALSFILKTKRTKKKSKKKKEKKNLSIFPYWGWY